MASGQSAAENGRPRCRATFTRIASQGNAQTNLLGNLVVGWGALPYFSEFNPAGGLVFNAQFPTGVNTYRAYQLPFLSLSGSGQLLGHTTRQAGAGSRVPPDARRGTARECVHA